MSNLKFSDGMEFDLSGPLRIEEREDGYYVVGQNTLIPVNSQKEGLAQIQRMGGSADIESEDTDLDPMGPHGSHVHPTFESYVYEANSLKDLVGKSDEEELDLDDARSIGKKISKMKGEDRKKYVGIVNFMGASCRIYNEIWANYKTVDPDKKKANRGKEFRGDKEIG